MEVDRAVPLLGASAAEFHNWGLARQQAALAALVAAPVLVSLYPLLHPAPSRGAHLNTSGSVGRCEGSLGCGEGVAGEGASVLNGGLIGDDGISTDGRGGGKVGGGGNTEPQVEGGKWGQHRHLRGNMGCAMLRVMRF